MLGCYLHPSLMDRTVVPPKKIREFSPQIVPFTCFQSSGSERIHRVISIELSHEKKPSWFIGILTMASYNPHLTV